jgi:hypothetical protein
MMRKTNYTDDTAVCANEKYVMRGTLLEENTME